MKRYFAFKNQGVSVDDNGIARTLDPGPSQAIFNHSPDGFNWGYAGSGPSQLALAILLDHGLSPRLAEALHQGFKRQFIESAPLEGFSITDLDVDAFVSAMRQINPDVFERVEAIEEAQAEFPSM